MKTYFEKRKSELVTFRSCKIEAVMDFILVNYSCRSTVKNNKVIPGKN